MDYKREYEAMVQRARELHEGGNALTKRQMEIVCPELAESKDEKIRKALICGLSEGLSEHNWQGFGGATIDECIAYLEKQKDSNDMAFHEGYTLGFEDGMKSAEKFARSYDQGTCDGIAQDCFKAGANWQKEQLKEEAIVGEIVDPEYLWRIIGDTPSDILFKRGFRDGDLVRVNVSRLSDNA